MSEPNEQDTEHEDGEGTEAPVSPGTVVDDETAEEEEHEAETGAQEPAEASAPKSEKEIDRALKAVERAGTSYRTAIGRAMGEDAQALEVCPRCNAPVAGMIFPPEVAPVDDEMREAVLASVGLGSGGPRQLREARGVSECDSCDGWGILSFPTKVPHVQEQSCPKCQGSGYTLDQPEQAAPLVIAPPVTAGNNVEAATAPPCPLCNAPDSAGKPHWCVPQPAQVGV